MAREKMEEQERKRGIEERMREKKLYQDEMKAMQEQLRKDKEARFGKKYEEIQREQGPAEKTPEEKVAHAMKTIKTLYPNFRHPGVARTCLATLRIYTNNALNNPGVEKFTFIRKENKAFQDRVAKVTGGAFYLKAVGFIEEPEHFHLANWDANLLQMGLSVLDATLATLET